MRSVRARLTAWYVGAVTLFLAVFIALDYASLRKNLMQRADEMPAEAIAEALSHGLWEHVLMSLGLILIISIVGYVAIGRALRPVQRIVAQTRSITAEDLSQRIAETGLRDEIGMLVDTLNEMIARLQQSFEQVRRFSGDVSHELNTPLTVLKGELEVALRKERTPEEYRELLARLQGEVERLSRMVDDLLLLARLDEQPALPEMSAVPLDRVLLEAHEELYRLAADKGVALDLGQSDEVQVRGDAVLLRRMIVNLVHNGIKFTPAGGRVDLTLKRENDRAVLRVSDSGAGIPEDALPHVFERLFRADPARAEREGGAGLGLSIVKQVADLHGCEVALESRPGEGTAVTVGWPGEALGVGERR